MMNNSNSENDHDFDPTANSWHLPADRTVKSSVRSPVKSIESRMNELHQLSLMLHQPDETAYADEVGRRSTEFNQRQFTRCPLPKERTEGLLSMNGRRYRCRLVELSIGGFGVVVEGQTKFEQGWVGSLRAPGMNYVVNVTRQENRHGAAYVGLKQLEEVLDGEQRLPGDPSPILGYLIACVAGALIATVSYYFMNA